jgi:hypothetical protein
VLWRYEEDKKPASSTDDVTFGDVGVNYKASSKENEIVWQGTEFKITTSEGLFTCNGQISDDGSELVYLDVMDSWDSGTRGSASYTLRNVPLTKSTGIDGSSDSVEFTNQFGYYAFEFNATGTEVKSYISSQSHHSEYDVTNGIVARNFESWDPNRADRQSFEIKFHVTQGD